MMPTALGIAGGAAMIGVGLVFLAASLAKLRSRALFPGVVANYRLLPDRLVAPVGIGLPYAELAIGIALLAGSPLAVAPAIGLLLVFAGAMAINIGRGRAHIDCGCGRPELRQTLSRTLVLRNIVLSTLLVPAFGGMPDPISAQWLIALAAGVALFLLTHLVNAIAALANGPLAAMQRNSR